MPAADRHAPDFLDLGPRDRLMIGDDRQRFDRGTAELAGLDRFALHQEAQIGAVRMAQASPTLTTCTPRPS